MMAIYNDNFDLNYEYFKVTALYTILYFQFKRVFKLSRRHSWVLFKLSTNKQQQKDYINKKFFFYNFIIKLKKDISLNNYNMKFLIFGWLTH